MGDLLEKVKTLCFGMARGTARVNLAPIASAIEMARKKKKSEMEKEKEKGGCQLLKRRERVQCAACAPVEFAALKALSEMKRVRVELVL